MHSRVVYTEPDCRAAWRFIIGNAALLETALPAVAVCKTDYFEVSRCLYNIHVNPYLLSTAHAHHKSCNIAGFLGYATPAQVALALCLHSPRRFVRDIASVLFSLLPRGAVVQVAYPIA